MRRRTMSSPDWTGSCSSRQSLALRPVVACLEAGDEAVVFADRDDRVDQRESALQVLTFLAHDAPGHGDGALGRLPLPQLVELGVDALLGRLPHHARVQDRDVGALERLLDIARRQQLACDALGIRRVHLAPDGPDVERPRSDYRLSTSSRIPVRSSPSIDMSMT